MPCGRLEGDSWSKLVAKEQKPVFGGAGKRGYFQRGEILALGSNLVTKV